MDSIDELPRAGQGVTLENQSSDRHLGLKHNSDRLGSYHDCDTGAVSQYPRSVQASGPRPTLAGCVVTMCHGE